MVNRRVVLDGLARVMDAGGLEELFAGSEQDAAFVYDLLADAARARRSTYYWEICRTARRRGVTPEFVIDRAAVFVASMQERRRADLYRILGVPPLASGEVIRQRWLDVAKRHHPDVGGDVTRFRQAKEAYEILREPSRRVEYERFWLAALSPFERVAPPEDRALVDEVHVMAAAPPTWPPAPAVPPATEAVLNGSREALLQTTARLFELRDTFERRAAEVPGVAAAGGLGPLIARLETALARIRQDELAVLQAQIDDRIRTLGTFATQLAQISALKRRLAS